MKMTDAVVRAVGRVRYLAVLSFTAGAITGLGTLVGSALPQYTVSQKGRQFHPSQMTIKRGDTIVIVNDDGDLLHHAYVDSGKFSFDSGDLQPGSRIDITFPVSGTFDVLCGIHPKMKLEVRVE